jgi:hypothetical protein
MFSRSLDCGKTWSTPVKLSESNSINQGTNMAIEPTSGAIYVTWRRFATSSAPDAIVVAKSTDFGKTFPSKNTKDVATIAPFDQGTTPTQFRTNALPTMAASPGRVYVAWAQRDSVTGDARIMLSSSPDGSSWSAPVKVADAPITDDLGNSFSRGHQFMPQLTSVAGRLVLVYYDQRLDHTIDFHIPNNPFAPDSQGRFYLVRRDPKGELPAHPEQVFTLGIDDATLTLRRHTVDLRVGLAPAGAAPSFTPATVSQYRFGLTANDTGTPTELAQLQFNAPNLPLFSQGTLPFLGDYIDVAGQNFLANGAGGWTFNTSTSSPLVAYAAWTDNRDVKPPMDGNWANYTPTGPVHTSVLDPTQQTPPCVVGQEGMRNQNIYSSRITEGLLVGSPQNVKPLSPTLQRSFVVTLQNLTGKERTFHLTVTQPSGGQASFLQTSSQTALDVTIGPRSGAARPVFAKSSNMAASFVVNVAEVGGSLTGSMVMNPEGSVSPLAQPDGTTADIGTLEIYTPGLQVWNPASPNPFLNISNPNQVLNISNLNISNVDPTLNISNLNISNLNISNLNISNPDPAALNISNLNISNTAAANLNISNLNISNLNISNTPISETSYAVSNTGNTAHSYRVALYGNNPYGNTPLQVIVTKNSTMPASASCTLLNQPQSVVVSNVNNALVVPLDQFASASSPNIPDSSVSNSTMALAPGETAFVTLRAALTPDQMTTLTQGLTPVVTAHGTNTNGSIPDFVALLFIQLPNGSTLPAAVVGTSYTATLQAAGGKAPLTWVVAPGSTLPAGLTLSTAGVLSGTPSASGSFSFTVKVTDSTAGTPQSATQTFQLSIAGRKTDTSIAFGANPITFGQSTSVTVTVTDTQAGGNPSSPAGTIPLTGSGLSAPSCLLQPAGPAASACTVTVTPPSAGTDLIGANFSATATHQLSGATSGLTVNPAGTATALVSSLNPSLVGQSVTFTATVTSAAGVPGGTVTFLDGAAALGSSALSGGVGTFTTTSLTAGTHPITAVFGASGNFAGSSSAVLNQTVIGTYTFTGFLSPMATAGTVPAPTFSGNANYGSATPVKWTLKDASGNVLTDLSTTQSLTAVAYTGGLCSGQAAGASTLLYSPTTGAKGNSTFRNSNGQFIFNWDTAVVPGPNCYELILQLNDGSAPRATIERLN